MVPRDQIYSLVSVASDAATIPIDYGGSDDDLLFQLLCLVESSLCLCTWVCLKNMLNFPKLDNGFRYKVPVFKVPVRPIKTDGHEQLRCPICGTWHNLINDWEDEEIERHFICTKQVCDAVSVYHIYLSKHQSDTGMYYTVCQAERYRTPKLEVLHVEVEGPSFDGFGTQLPPLLNVYLEATVLIDLIQCGSRHPLDICSNARKGKGPMSFHQASFAENVECALNLLALEEDIGKAPSRLI
jgi:hypothetical protein